MQVEEVSLSPNADMRSMDLWMTQQQELDYQCFMQLRELLGDLEGLMSTIKQYDKRNGSHVALQVLEARWTVDSRETACENMLRAINGQPALDMPKRPVELDVEDDADEE